MRAADYIVDVGPGAGVHGGEIMAQRHAAGDHERARLHHRASISPARGASPCPRSGARATGNFCACSARARTTCKMSTCASRWAA